MSTRAKALTLLNLSAVLGDIDHDEHGLRWGLEAVCSHRGNPQDGPFLLSGLGSDVQCLLKRRTSRDGPGDASGQFSRLAACPELEMTGLLSGPGLPQRCAAGCEAGALGRSAGVHTDSCALHHRNVI